MPGRRDFLKAFYAKYAPDQQLSEERFNAIDQKYQDDATLLKDLYSKYAPKENLSDERINAIQQKYELSQKKSGGQVLENGLTEEQDREKNLNQLNQDYFSVEPTVQVKSDATNIAPPSELKSATRSEMLELNKISQEYEDSGASQSLGSFNKAIVEGVAALPKSVGILAKKLDDLTGAKSKKIEDYPTYQAGQWLEDKALELGITATDPTQNEFLTSQVPSALGSVASILLTGMGGLEGQAGKLAATAPKGILGQAGKAASFVKNPATVSGGLQMAVPEYEAAKAKGLSDDEAFTVFLKNYAVGQTEALPLASAFSKINKLTGGNLIEVLKAGGTQGLEEATQEVIQNYFTNQIAQGSYDPERDPMMGLMDAAKTGFFVGFILPGLGAAFKNASPEDRAKVNSFINQKLKDKASAANGATDTGGDGQAGAATTQTASEPVQFNAEGQNQQAGQEPVQQSANEAGQPGAVEPAAVLGKPFEIKGQTKFFHASPQKRQGRLNPSTAKQFGQGIYFSTNKEKVAGEFGDNVSEVELRIEKPVETGTKEYNQVEQLALDNYNKTPPVDGDGVIEGEKVDVADIPSKYISDAAIQLGYDAIIDKDSSNYDNEIVVLDESKIVYPEDKAKESKTPTPIRQLGTGANVYFESNKYRVNDTSTGKILLNVGDKNDEVPLANIEFDNVKEAIYVAEKLNDIIPEGLTSGFHNVETIIDNLKNEYAEGFDSIYLPETETQEGELIVFDRNKVTIGSEQPTGSEIPLQDQQPAGDGSGTGQGAIENDPKKPVGEGSPAEDNKVVDPPEPPAKEPPEQEEEKEPNKKERKVAKRYMADPDVSDEIKSGLSEEGRYYIPKTDLGSQAEADAYIEEKGIDQAIDDITDPDNGMSDRNRVFIGKTIYRLLKDEIKTSETPNAVRDKINRLLEDIAKLGTTAGQTVQAFANMFTSDADQVAYALQKDYDRQRNKAAEYAEPQIASLQSLVDQATDEALRDLLNDPRIKKLLEESRASENVRQTKRKQFTKRILDKLDEIEKQIDDSGKNKLFMDVTFGLAPLAYKAAINIIRVAVKAGDSLIDAVEKAVNEINLNNKGWDEDGFRKLFEADIKEEGKRDRKTLLEVLSNSGDTFKSLAQSHYKNYAGRKKSIQQLLQDELGLNAQEAERLGKTLDKIVGEKRKKIIETKYGAKIKTPKAKRVTKTLADKIEEFTNLGVLSEKNLREAYLASIDLPAITDQQSNEMERLVQEAESKPNGFARYEAIQRLIRYHQKITPLNWMEVGESIWYANMLSGISTQALNFQANSVATMAETLVSIPQSIFEYKDPKAAFKNFAFMLRGMADGYKRNLAESANVLQNGYQPMKGGKFDESSFRGVKTSKGSILETLDNPLKYWKYVGRLMAATDILFYGGLKGMRAHQLAFRNAYNQNKNTVSSKMLADAETILGETNNQVTAAQQKAASEGFTGRDLQRRTYEIMEQSWSEEMREDANSFASKGTYNYEPEGVLGIATGVINNATSKLPVLKTVVPFSRVISNVLNDYLNYTPWGLVRAAKGGMGIPGKGSYRRFSQEELLREKIKGVMGTAAMVALYAMTASDDDDEPFLEITADGTGNMKKNYELGETGWKQYSFKLRGTNTWFSYQNTPLAIPFAVIGYIRDSAKYKGEEVSEEKLGMILSGVIHYITDMSFMSGLSDFFEIISSKDVGSTAEKIGMFANRTVKTAVVPNLFTQVSRGVQEIIDSPMKRGDGLFGQYIRDIPMLRDVQGTMYNALGEPIVTETLYKFNPIMTRFTSESDQEKKETYKVWELIVENEAYIGAPSKSTKIYDPKQGIERKFTEDEYQKFALKSGQNTRQMLLNYYPSLAAMTDKKQVQKRITDIKEQARERAKSEMFQEMNSKY